MTRPSSPSSLPRAPPSLPLATLRTKQVGPACLGSAHRCGRPAAAAGHTSAQHMRRACGIFASATRGVAALPPPFLHLLVLCLPPAASDSLGLLAPPPLALPPAPPPPFVVSPLHLAVLEPCSAAPSTLNPKPLNPCSDLLAKWRELHHRHLRPGGCRGQARVAGPPSCQVSGWRRRACAGTWLPGVSGSAGCPRFRLRASQVPWREWVGQAAPTLPHPLDVCPAPTVPHPLGVCPAPTLPHPLGVCPAARAALCLAAAPPPTPHPPPPTHTAPACLPSSYRPPPRPPPACSPTSRCPSSASSRPRSTSTTSAGTSAATPSRVGACQVASLSSCDRTACTRLPPAGGPLSPLPRPRHALPHPAASPRPPTPQPLRPARSPLPPPLQALCLATLPPPALPSLPPAGVWPCASCSRTRQAAGWTWLCARCWCWCWCTGRLVSYVVPRGMA